MVPVNTQLGPHSRRSSRSLSLLRDVWLSERVVGRSKEHPCRLITYKPAEDGGP